MTYQETIQLLYDATPQFQRIGAAAYKPGLDTALKLAAAFGNPERKYRSVHVAGTNGKGSTCHTLAAVLQSAGYKVGLYTSPHLIDFRERIRVNGEVISEQGVIDFMDRYNAMALDLSPSFFELTTIMAFDWFASQEVDIAIIETGLGGRLDTTNIITPLLSIITNISFDHTAQLGNTLEAIASEKAGIIKPGVPVIIGNPTSAEVLKVFVDKAAEQNSRLIFSRQQEKPFQHAIHLPAGNAVLYPATPFGDITSELTGDYQSENAANVMAAVMELREIGFDIPDKAVAEGFANVTKLTGLMGRWMKVGDNPTVICDTGHNEGGWRWLSQTLRLDYLKVAKNNGKLAMVIGFVNDKDVSSILKLMPKDALYFFTQASIPRAMAADEVAKRAIASGLEGKVVANVAEAVNQAKAAAGEQGMVFVGGSTFVVADYLASIQNTTN